MPDGYFPAERVPPVSIPLREAGPMSDDPEIRRWERYKDFFAQRERQSHTAIKILRTIEGERITADEPLTQARVDVFLATIEERVGKDLQEASPEMRAAFRQAATNWAAHSVRAERIMRGLVPGAPNEAHEWDDSARVEAGYRMFIARVGREPSGAVRFLRKGPFFYFSFLDTKDYLAFKACFSNEGEAFESGLFMPRSQWSPYTIVPTILQKGDDVNASVLAHEGQHFINHSLGMIFKNWEQGAESGSSPESAELPEANMHRDLKDEVIAYVRGGTDPLEIQKILVRGGDYDKLYKTRGITDEKAQKAEAILKNICQALSEHVWIRHKYSRHQTHLRELMAATLLDIPLRKMEGYIRFSNTYYTERVEAVSVTPPRSRFTPDAAGELAWQEAVMAHRQNQSLALGLMPEYLEEERTRPTDPKSLEAGMAGYATQKEIDTSKRSSKIKRTYYDADWAWARQPTQRRRIDQE